MNQKFFVQEEVGELKTVGLFGPPGIESYLAQFWPDKESLFFGSFNVEKAQQEFKGLVEILESLQVEVLDLKKVYASTLSEPELSAENLLKKLSEKVPDSDPKILEKMLETDISSYGEKNAVALNIALSYNPQIPMGNIYFARDQSNVFMGTCILGNMAFTIRKPEVEIIYKALNNLGYSKFLTLNKGIFEGGDGMILGGKAYIGSGMRTTPQAIEEIADYLKIPTFMVGIQMNGDWKQDMEMMHLDTFFMPLTYSKVIGCKTLLERCTIHNLQNREKMNFLKYLEGNFDVLDIPHEEQKNYAANMLVVSPGKVIIPSTYNIQTSETLKERGIITINAGLQELTQGIGATHCMVLQLEKYKV